MDELEATSSTQQWKLNETLSRKEGVRRSIYEITRKKNSVEDGLDSGKDEWEIGRTYTGEWADDLRDGYGVQIWSNQCKYEGDWKRNQRNGHGVYWVPATNTNTKSDTNSNSNQNDITSIYEKTSSELSNFTSHNVGNLLRIREELQSLKRKDNKKRNDSKSCSLHKQYEGEWKNDLKHGKGTFYHQNGDKFEGIFGDGLRSGYGIMYYSNGDKYEGDWKYDQKNGFGIYLNHKDNTIYTGYWMNDQKEGPGYFRYHHTHSGGANDKLYVAEWVNHTPRCGYFVNINDVEIDLKSIASQKQLIPTLGLLNADSILSAEIKQIRKRRKLVRSLTIIDDVDDLFEDEHEDQELKMKIIDIFEQISIPLKQNQSVDHERCYVEKEDLFGSIQDFKMPSKYEMENGTETLNLAVAAYCNDLGVRKSDKGSDDSNTVLILTLLEFAKIVYLLLND